MSKAEHERRRYVAMLLTTEGNPPSRGQVARALDAWKATLGNSLQLTRYEWPHALIRIERSMYLELRDAFPLLLSYESNGKHVPIRAESLLSSGSIKQVTTSLGILLENPRK